MTESGERPDEEKPDDRAGAGESEAPAGAPQEDSEAPVDPSTEPRTRRRKAKAESAADEEPVAEEAPVPEEELAEEEDLATEEEPVAPAPAPAALRDRSANGPFVVRAHAKYVRSSARKARLVCDLIRGKSVEDARAILATTTRGVAEPWSKLLESAVANAENNHELDGDDLRILAIHADEGPTLKRYRPRAMGRATRIRKRTSHLSIQLTPKER